MDRLLGKLFTWSTMFVLTLAPLGRWNPPNPSGFSTNLFRMRDSTIQAAFDFTAENSQENFELLGQLGGTAQTLKVSVSLAYAGFGTGFDILDISDAAQIRRLGWLAADGKVLDISINGNYAYLAYQGKLQGEYGPVGLDIVDISHPDIPVIVNRLEFRYCGSSPKVIFNGSDAYFAYNACDAFGGIIQSAGAHLLRLDVTTPNKPTVVADFESFMSSIEAIALQDDRLYAIFDMVSDPLGDALKVFDVSSASEIIETGSAIVSEQSQDISPGGNYAFLASGEDGLQVVDVSDPFNPVSAITYSLPAEAWTIHTQGSTALIGTDVSQILVVDITDPLNPALTGSYTTSGISNDIDIQDGIGYLTNGFGGLEIFDISTLSRAGLFTYPQGINGIIYSAPFAYLAAGDGFWALDITHPRTPVILAHLATCQPAVSLVLKSGYAILACPNDGLRMIDISNPSTPFEAGAYTLPGDLSGLALTGDQLFVAAGTAGMQIFNIANPLTPQQIGAYTPAYGINAIAASGSLVYLGSDNGNLAVVDVSDPSAPQELAVLDPPDQLGTGQSCTDVAIYNNTVVFTTIEPPPTPLAGYFTGDVWLIDVSDPEKINLTGKIPNAYGFAPESINLKNDRLFVAYERQGLILYDITNLSSPEEIGFFEPNEYLYGVSDAGEHILLFNSSLYITRYIDPSLPAISGWITHPNRQPKPGVIFSTGDPLSENISNLQGVFSLRNLSDGSYTLVPSLSGYVFSPASRVVSVPPSAYSQNFTILAEPVSAQFEPGIDLTLAFTDTQGLPTWLEIPADASAQTLTLTLAPSMAEAAPGYAFTGHAFELAVEQASARASNYIFDTPVTLTIQYSRDDIAVISDPQNLTLWWWNGSSWQNASQSCNPASEYFRDTENRILSLSICQSGIFKLMGPTHQVILPVIMIDK